MTDLCDILTLWVKNSKTFRNAYKCAYKTRSFLQTTDNGSGLSAGRSTKYIYRHTINSVYPFLSGPGTENKNRKNKKSALSYIV